MFGIGSFYLMSSRIHKIKTVTKIRVALWVSALFFVFLPPIRWWHAEGYNRFTVFMDGVMIGKVADPQHAEDLYRAVRREYAAGVDGISLVNIPKFTYEGEEMITGEVDDDELLKSRMMEKIQKEQENGLHPAYSVKVGSSIVSVKSAEDARRMLEETIGEYDTEKTFRVNLVKDMNRELNVLVPEIVHAGTGEAAEESVLKHSGAGAVTESELNWEFSGTEGAQGFDAYVYGITDIGFSERIEVVEAYLPETQVLDYETARAQLTQQQEQQQIYKVQSGDTLSEISIKVGLPLDAIVAMNDELDDENSIIRVDQELIITVPEPQLSVIWTEVCRDDRIFDLPTEYIYNNSWYTDKKVTRQQPSAGYHETVAQITRRNGEELSKEVLYEEVGMEAVAKVIEVGTQVPPSYIKPLAGGRISSGFGPRTAPTAGASTYHKGVDIKTPTGTTVWASCGGTVTFAGWGGAYGNVIFIDHADGRQTRYAHLSKIYVSVGQHVDQGQKIAASGSTGRSTGPHLHFELRIGGVPVDPRKYVNLY